MHEMDKNAEERKESAGDYETDLMSMIAVPDETCRHHTQFDTLKGYREGISIELDDTNSERLSDSNTVKCRIAHEDNDGKDTSTESHCLSSSSTTCECKLENTEECLETLSISDSEQIDEIIFQQDNDGDNLLFMSIIDKRLSLAMSLITLASGAICFDMYNELYQTALHLASLMNMPTVVRRLVAAGAIVDRRDRNCNTALHIACKNGYIDVAEALLAPVRYHETKLNNYAIPYQKIPQNLEIRNSDGLTCLHLAVLDHNTEMISLLVSKDADINTVEMKAGKTCLHIAAEHGDISIVSDLIEHPHCDLDKETFAGYTASELALCRGSHEIERLLYNSGASIPRSVEEIEQSRVFIDVLYDEYDVEIITKTSDDSDDDDADD